MRKLWSSPVRRSSFGLLIGVILSAIGMWAVPLAYGTAKQPHLFFLGIAFPMGGFAFLIDQAGVPLAMQIMAFFYPLLLTVFFYAVGKKQTWRTVLLEVLLAIILLGAGFVGFAISIISD